MRTLFRPFSTVNRLARRSGILKGEGAIDTLLKALSLERQGHKIIHLEIGDPNFDTPLHIRQAAIQSMTNGETHYNTPPGIPELRSIISEYFSSSRNISCRPDHVIAFPGLKPGIFSALLAAVEEGDEVIIPNPGYPCYETTIRWVGGVPVSLPLLEENGFRFDVNHLQRLVTKKTKMIIINSPQNPTGGVLMKSDLEAIAEIAQRHNLYVLSDEIYCQVNYDGLTPSIASIPGLLDRTILLDGCSKTYAMTGWRLGFGHFPRELVDPIINIAINSWTCLPVFIQRAAIEAIQGPQGFVLEINQAFKKRRDLVVNALNEIPGVKCLRPMGAFYAFPNITGTGLTSKQCANYLLEEAKVALLPGTDYGTGGEGYLRLSFANSDANIKIALQEIRRALCDKAKIDAFKAKFVS